LGSIHYPDTSFLTASDLESGRSGDAYRAAMLSGSYHLCEMANLSTAGAWCLVAALVIDESQILSESLSHAALCN